MVSSPAMNEAEENFIDRRAAERFKIDMKAYLLAYDEKYPITIKDVSIYGLGIAAQDSGLGEELQPKQDVFIEWGPDGETIHAMVVWCYKGHYGFVIKPALDEDHPLIVQGKALKDQ